MKKLFVAFCLMTVLISCSPPAPYNIHCIWFNIVPTGTTMQNMTEKEGVFAYYDGTTTATEDRYCFTNKAADVGGGRLELLAQDRINLKYYLVESQCKDGDKEVPINAHVYDYGMWWDKYDREYKYTVYPPGYTSGGNFCFTGEQTVATNNHTFVVSMYSFAYNRLEKNPKVLELKDFVLVKE